MERCNLRTKPVVERSLSITPTNRNTIFDYIFWEMSSPLAHWALLLGLLVPVVEMTTRRNLFNTSLIYTLIILRHSFSSVSLSAAADSTTT